MADSTTSSASGSTDDSKATSTTSTQAGDAAATDASKSSTSSTSTKSSTTTKSTSTDTTSDDTASDDAAKAPGTTEDNPVANLPGNVTVAPDGTFNNVPETGPGAPNIPDPTKDAEGQVPSNDPVGPEHRDFSMDTADKQASDAIAAEEDVNTQDDYVRRGYQVSQFDESAGMGVLDHLAYPPENAVKAAEVDQAGAIVERLNEAGLGDGKSTDADGNTLTAQSVEEADRRTAAQKAADAAADADATKS